MKLSARCLLPAFATLGLALPAQAQPAMWEVRDDDSAIWLFGSFHVLPEGTAWRTELFDTLLADADRIVFETDIRPAAAAQVGAEAYMRGVYTDGTLLTDVLGETIETQLRAKAADIDMPMGMVQAMKPWLAANTITVQAMAGKGFAADGVELLLLPDLPEERLGFLETGSEQLEVLAGASDEEQVAMLVATLDQLDTLPKVMDKMLRSWMSGTPDQLSDAFITGMGGYEAGFLERLLYARNRNWIAPIETMLADNSENLIVVGAAHLIGDSNVLELLEQAGYAVERIQ
ncbi:TraB/GumN family protein [Devosia ginsengisoli]|uniref:TraB/GumN family protein n=1 Tax=Devosia ginsengisoli TaxID=400770 RepID=A0A5B8LQS7_9HYPH|nr:TraB/GumN family protein [Devosia ginsengisoli]QDZ10034.1 TraB/GumN family protein [Devosia ginsengisoli]